MKLFNKLLLIYKRYKQSRRLINICKKCQKYDLFLSNTFNNCNIIVRSSRIIIDDYELVIVFPGVMLNEDKVFPIFYDIDYDVMENIINQLNLEVLAKIEHQLTIKNKKLQSTLNKINKK